MDLDRSEIEETDSLPSPSPADQLNRLLREISTAADSLHSVLPLLRPDKEAVGCLEAILIDSAKPLVLDLTALVQYLQFGVFPVPGDSTSVS